MYAQRSPKLGNKSIYLSIYHLCKTQIVVDRVETMWFSKTPKTDKKLQCTMYLNLLYIAYFNKASEYTISAILFVKHTSHRYSITYLYRLLLENSIIVFILAKELYLFYCVFLYLFYCVFLSLFILLCVFLFLWYI